MTNLDGPATERITVFLADDNLLVREGVRTLLALEPDLEVVGVGADYDELVDGAEATNPQVVVTDIRMPPTFQQEGIEAAKEVRKRHPGTGIVVLSQYDEPEYAISLLEQGAAGYAYLLKDRVTDGNRLARAVREVATGGSMLDPEIVQALVSPVRGEGELSAAGRRPAARGGRGTTGEGHRRRSPLDSRSGERRRSRRSSCNWPRGPARAARARCDGCACCRRPSWIARSRARRSAGCCPAGWPRSCASDRGAAERTERLEVTVLMSDVRGYSAIAEVTDPTVLAGQLNTHRREMNAAILEEEGTVMQYVGDAVMAVFGAPFPQPDHADRAVRAASGCTRRQAAVNLQWTGEDLSPFGLGIGLSTGEVAAALLGSDERLEYTLVGDTVNLAQRLQDLARPGGHHRVQRCNHCRFVPSCCLRTHGPDDGQGSRGSAQSLPNHHSH